MKRTKCSVIASLLFSDPLLMLSVVNFQHSHDGIICKVKQGIANGLICHSLLIAVRGENAGEGLKTAELITQANAWHCHSFFNVGLVEAVAVVVVLFRVKHIQPHAKLAMRGQVMQIKKAGGKIFGASLTAAEQKAMNMEIQRQLVEYDRKNELELDAIILWELHTQLGLGPKRLKKFFDGFSDALNALVNRYEMDISDDFWLCTHKLKEIGVDVEDWYRQKE